MKKILPLLITLALMPSAFAEDLIQVYQQAKQTNPDLKSAWADREKSYSAISGSRANLLPQLGLNASYGLSKGYRDTEDQNSKSGSVALTLSQSLFNFGYWKNLDITEKQASIADITYQAQQQALILNTAVSYFNVLKSLDELSYVEAESKAIYKQLDQTKQKHEVGLVAITDVQNAQANYDLTIAQRVTALNNLNNALEELRRVSGYFYANLASIETKLFNTQELQPINKLLKQAESSNLDLLTTKLSQDIAKEQIRLAQAGHLPTLSLEASTNLARSESYGDRQNLTPTPHYGYNKSIQGQHRVSINLNIPIFSGGATQSSVEQAQYNYVSASEQLESKNREIINQMRSSYNNILTSVSSIKAYQQSVISAESSLNSTQSGYDVGTRTIVDVLTATTQLYSAKKNLSNAKYDYLTNLLQLKYAIGTLTPDDLTELNNMLGKQVSTIVTLND